MSFHHPEFLYGLFALLIPVIIHLFNFRRYKKLYFSNIEFLKNITTETRKQNKLKHLIVLFLRILAFVFIVLAFAGPKWGKSGNTTSKSGEKIRSIYIDNSFSMMAEGENGQLFQEAINSGRKLIEQSARDIRFTISNNEAGSGRNTLNKEATLSTLEKINISPAHRSMSSVLQSLVNLNQKKKGGNYETFIFSDFQQNAFDTENFPRDSLGEYFFIPLKQNNNRNIYIDSCWMETPVLIPGKHARLLIRVKNVSSEDYEKVPLTVKIDNQQKAVAGINLKAKGSETINVSFTLGKPGWHRGLIEIEDYPITFDDKLFFAFNVAQHIRVLEIYEGKAGSGLRLFYQSDSLFQFQQMSYRKVDYNQLNTFQLIILNSLPSFSSGLLAQLNSFAVQGGNILFIPNADAEITEQNKLLTYFQSGKITAIDTAKSRVVRIKQSHKMFSESISKIPENADLPIVNKHYRLSYPISSGLESLIGLLNGDDFLLKKKTGKGALFLLSTPLGSPYTNFSSQALFVPVMYGVAITGNSLPHLYYTIKKDEILTTDIHSIPSGETPFSLQNTSTNYLFIPEQKTDNGELQLILRNNNIESDGFYNLRLNDSTWRIFAFNFNRSESQTTFFSVEEIKAQLKNSKLANFQVLNTANNAQTNVINSLQTASKLWMLFIIFALLMLLAEVLVLRFWK